MGYISSQFVSISTLSSTGNYEKDQKTRYENGGKIVVESIYTELISPHTLITESADFLPPLQEKVKGKLVSTFFFTNSLKKLYIQPWTVSSPILSARNVVWLLIFSPHLREAAIAFNIDCHQDFSYLSEFSSTCGGLSKVQHLAQGIRFSYEEGDKSTWWGLSKKKKKDWKGGNKKTEYLHHLLKVTNKLRSLKIWWKEPSSRSADSTELSTGCLSSLHWSFESLEHIRLLMFGGDVSFTDYSLFKGLKVFSVDAPLLDSLTQSNQLSFPSSLETLILPYYYCHPSMWWEQPSLNNAVYWNFSSQQDFVPSLKKVVVPFDFIDPNGISIESKAHRETWKKRMKGFDFRRRRGF